MGNLRITKLDQSDSDQIQSNPPLSTEVGYQAAVFTLPPNCNNPDGRRQISVVSVDSESFTGEDDQQRVERLHHNGLHADRRANERIIFQAEEVSITTGIATPGLHGGVHHRQGPGTSKTSSSWITTAIKSSPRHSPTWPPSARYSKDYPKLPRLQKLALVSMLQQPRLRA